MMDASMYRYMDVGLIHFMAYPQTIKGDGPVLETVRQIAEDDYFTFIEITWIKDPAVRNQVRDMLNQAGMKVAFAAQPALLTQKLSLNTTDETERRRAVEQVKACIDEAYLRPCGSCGARSRRSIPPRREEAVGLVIKGDLSVFGIERRYAGGAGDVRPGAFWEELHHRPYPRGG